MKNKVIVFWVLLLAWVSGVAAGVIQGKVTDANSGDPLSGVSIRVKDTAIEVHTDSVGHYKIENVPNGSQTLVVRHMGYAALTITEVRVKKRQVVKLDIVLQPETVKAEQMTISAAQLNKKLKSGAPAVEDRVEKFEAKIGKTHEDRKDSETLPALYAPPPSAPSAPSGLKAGFADDNQQYNYFLQFLQKYQGQVPNYPLAVQERLSLMVKDAQGKSLPNANIQVFARDQLLTEGKTFSNGTFLFFPSEYGPGASEYKFQISYLQQRREIVVDRRGNRTVEVSLPIAKIRMQSVPVDILFILDTTGSMGEEIERLKKTIEIIHMNLTALTSRPNIRFGLVLYRDQQDDYVTQVIPLGDDLDLFRQRLNAVEAGGGGDEPEDLQSALKAAMTEIDWRPDGIRLAFIITDAPAHLDYDQTYTYVDAARDAKKAGIKIFTVGTGGLNLAGEFILRQIAQYTLAQYIFLTYGERGDSEGGQPGSVSHHVGSNFQTARLEAIIIRIAKQELSAFTDQAMEPEGDFFVAQQIPAEKKEETLRKLFDQALAQLLDYASLRVEEKTPTSLLQIAAADSALRLNAEYFTEQLLFSTSRNPFFALVDRSRLQAILAELELSQTGLIEEAKMVEIGKLVGAKLILASDFYLKDANYELFLKLLRVETGEVLSVTKMLIDADLGLK